MSSVEKVVEQSLLYDYYGELLTDHQRRIYEAAVFDNLSLGEIAEETGISRQGVYDLLKRCDGKLKQYEASLHLLERQERVRQLAEAMDGAVTELYGLYPEERTAERVTANPDGQGLISERSKEPNGQDLVSEQSNDPDARQLLDRLRQLVCQLLEEI
ncbi:MAG: hypothetical protein LUE16_01495 [Lachnospiraceae bacterium]|nr:hypothetical protein [Lachnospiraceae bacterium]